MIVFFTSFKSPEGRQDHGGAQNVHSSDSCDQVTLIRHLAAGDAKVDCTLPKETDHVTLPQHGFESRDKKPRFIIIIIFFIVYVVIILPLSFIPL